MVVVEQFKRRDTDGLPELDLKNFVPFGRRTRGVGDSVIAQIVIRARRRLRIAVGIARNTQSRRLPTAVLVEKGIGCLGRQRVGPS